MGRTMPGPYDRAQGAEEAVKVVEPPDPRVEIDRYLAKLEAEGLDPIIEIDRGKPLPPSNRPIT